MIYCIDTSAWLDGWARSYPIDVFPSLWKKLDELATKNVIISSEEVYVELDKQDDGMHKWLMERKQILVPISTEIQGLVSSILAEHPRLVDTFRNRSQCDPFVIATAQHYNAVVVTGEKARGKLDIPKIPDVCQQKNIRCISFLEMVRELNLTF